MEPVGQAQQERQKRGAKTAAQGEDADAMPFPVIFLSLLFLLGFP